MTASNDNFINRPFILQRAVLARAIPSGETMTLEKGDEVAITQALGGSLTLRSGGGLYRVEAADADALGLSPETFTGSQPTPGDQATFSVEALWDALKSVFDPEIPVNIVDLGLIYDLVPTQRPDGRYDLRVSMTLTAPGCGMGPTIAGDARNRLEQVPFVASADVTIVWDPQWTPHMISPEGRKILGLE